MLQMPVVILKKSSISDMRHLKTYNYLNFQQNWVSRSVKTIHTNVFAKIISCIGLQIPIVFSKKSIISDKHHRITYMYIYFQQNRVHIEQSNPCTPTYLQKIVSCIICNFQHQFRNNRLFQTCIILQCTYISIFSKIRLVDQSKPCTQIYLQIIINCINLQLAIRISRSCSFQT